MLCGIPPFACFWSKDEILNDSWLYSPIFAIVACSTAGFTAFYMFRIYLLVFEGYLNVHCMIIHVFFLWLVYFMDVRVNGIYFMDVRVTYVEYESGSNLVTLL